MADSTHVLTPFGWPVVLYLTLAGIVSGLALWSAWTLLRGGAASRQAAVRGLGLAALGIGFGGIALVMDLEAPDRFVLILAHFNPLSFISWGARIIVLFGMLAAFSWWLLRHPSASEAPLTVGMRLAVSCLAVLAGLITLYPGLVLFQATARPLWSTPWIVPLFVVSAVHAGMAMMLLLNSSPEAPSRRLAGIELALVAAQAVFLGLWLVTESPGYGTAVERIIGGELSLWLWGGVVALGWIVPLALAAARGGGSFINLARASAVLLGTLALRAVVVFGGQGAEALITTLTLNQP